MVFSPYLRGFLIMGVLLILPLNMRVIFHHSLFADDDEMIEPAALKSFRKKGGSTVESDVLNKDFTHESRDPDMALSDSTTQDDRTPKHEIYARSQSDEETKKEPQDSLPLLESMKSKNQKTGKIRIEKSELDQTLEQVQIKPESQDILGGATITALAGKDEPDTFAACLQIMDDNHFLIEYLAYHYHVMPLRRIIVFADPHSRTSPEPILDRWKDRIDITLWHEKDVYPNGIPPPPDPKKNTTKLGEHRARQRRFIRNCLQTLHREGRAWVVLTDTDEYTMVNPRIKDPMDPLSPLNYLGKHLDLPSQEEPGSVMKVLKMKDVKIPHTGQNVHDNPCITMSRKTFGTKARDMDETTLVGSKAYNFQTLHWRYYDKTFKPGKALLNLKEIEYKDISSHPSVHRPITDDNICKGKLTVPEQKSLFLCNHYPGNLEQMLFRVFDARGDATNATAYRINRFNEYQKFADLYESDNIQSWLPGFVDSVGLEEACRLLEYVGLPKEAAYFDENEENVGGRAVSEHGESQIVHANGPSIASKDDLDTFGACVQIMDDNHFLIEWLAYHYHVLPLRRLIVFADPHSATTPQPILDRWKDRIDITLWHEKDVFPKGIPPPPDPKKNATKLGQHRARQRKFLSQCQQTLFREGRSWIVLTDTDEYTEINSILRDPGKLTWNSENITLPSQEEPGSVMKLLMQKNMKDLKTNKYIHEIPCITMARRTFSTREKPDSTSNILGFNSSQFQTLHWRYYSDLFKPGKALVNLSKLKYTDIPPRPSVHRPITNESICAGKLSVHEKNSVFAVNHYPGTLEQMLFRVFDARGDESNATAYRIERINEHKKLGKVLISDTIQQWLPGFIAAVGEKEAIRLLNNAGSPKEAAHFLSSPETE